MVCLGDSRDATPKTCLLGTLSMAVMRVAACQIMRLCAILQLIWCLCLKEFRYASTRWVMPQSRIRWTRDRCNWIIVFAISVKKTMSSIPFSSALGTLLDSLLTQILLLGIVCRDG